MVENSIDIRDVVLEFGSGRTKVRALDGVTMQTRPGEIVGIVGESGSGKSTIGYAIGRLMPDGVSPGAGTVEVLGKKIWDLPVEELREIRKHDIRYVFQDPIATLDPTKRIGWQVKNAYPFEDVDVIKALSRVGLPHPERIARSWPHELSGGMAQRVVIAIGLIGTPKILIADEATSALDASVRMQVLHMMRTRSKERDITLLLLSHDLAAIKTFCDKVAVVYAGRIVEFGHARAVFSDPAHPYTRALLASKAGNEEKGELLPTIPGIPPVLRGPSTGCAFARRCVHAKAGCCDRFRPETSQRAEGWSVLCSRWEELLAQSEEFAN